MPYNTLIHNKGIMFFSIKLKDFDVWAGKKHISYFVRDNSYFILTKQNIQSVLVFGVTSKRKRVFSSTDEIRRSLRCCNKETVVKTLPLSPVMLNCEVLAQGNSFGKFSNFVAVDLTNDKIYPLDDVISGLV